MFGTQLLNLINRVIHNFVLFIDDRVRMSWVYFLKHKSKVFDAFVKFYNMIVTQFQTKPQILGFENRENTQTCIWKTFLKPMALFTKLVHIHHNKTKLLNVKTVHSLRSTEPLRLRSMFHLIFCQKQLHLPHTLLTYYPQNHFSSKPLLKPSTAILPSHFFTPYFLGSLVVLSMFIFLNLLEINLNPVLLSVFLWAIVSTKRDIVVLIQSRINSTQLWIVTFFRTPIFTSNFILRGRLYVMT